MFVRRNCVEGQFYPSGAGECEKELALYTAFDPVAANMPRQPSGAVAPHAGWVFSGAVAGKVFSCFKNSGAQPETFFLFGAMHRSYSENPLVMPSGEWRTPLGPVTVDERAAAELISGASCPAAESFAEHENEHSIEVFVPFIKYLFPNAKIVPVLVPPNVYAEEIGAAAGKIMRSKSCGQAVAVGSTDLTHYGVEYGFAPKGTGEESLKWVREENDRSFIDLAAALDTKGVLEDSRKKRNACGAGAAAAAIAASREAGSTGGTLVEYTTSHDVMPRGKPSLFVGYAGMIF